MFSENLAPVFRELRDGKKYHDALKETPHMTALDQASICWAKSTTLSETASKSPG
jgi:hypothetical protein